jgi:hypothetical protein
MTEQGPDREVRHYPDHKKVYNSLGPILVPVELSLSEIVAINVRLNVEYGQVWYDSGRPATGPDNQVAFYRIIPRGITVNTPRRAMREVMASFNPIFSY